MIFMSAAPIVLKLAMRPLNLSLSARMMRLTERSKVCFASDCWPSCRKRVVWPSAAFSSSNETYVHIKQSGLNDLSVHF